MGRKARGKAPVRGKPHPSSRAVSSSDAGRQPPMRRGGHWGESHGLPVPTHPSLARRPPTRYSQRAHSSRTRRSVRAAPPAPTHPGTSSGAPSERLQGISKFAAAELATLLLSQAEDPFTNRCCKPPPLLAAGCSSGRRQPARLGSKSIPVPLKKGSPILTPSSLQGGNVKGQWQGADVTQGAL